MQAFDEWMESWLGAAWSAPALAVARVLMIVILAIVAQRLAARLLKLFRERVTARLAGQSDVQRVETVTRVIRYVATAVIALISGMPVLSELGISIAPILGAAGIVGLAIGFGDHRALSFQGAHARAMDGAPRVPAAPEDGIRCLRTRDPITAGDFPDSRGSGNCSHPAVVAGEIDR